MLSEVKESILNAYVGKTGQSRAKLSHLMDAETWMNAGKAMELGFCDGVLKREGTEDTQETVVSDVLFSRTAVNGVPAFEAETSAKPGVTETQSIKSVKATKPATKFDKSIAGAYKTTAALNMRNGAGKANKVLTVLKPNTRVQNYGYYSEVGGVKWLYVQVTVDKVKYTGFCSGKYLQRV